MVLDLLVEVAELGIPIGMLGALEALTLACRLNPSPFSSRPTVGAETGCPWLVSSSARCRNDLVVHRSGDIGSPRSSGSTSASRPGRAQGPAGRLGLGPPPAAGGAAGGGGRAPA